MDLTINFHKLWARAQDFLKDVEAIKMAISKQQLVLQLDDPSKPMIPGLYFTSFMHGLLSPPLGVICPESNPTTPGPAYEVLLVYKTKLPDLREAFKVVMVKKDEEQKKDGKLEPSATSAALTEGYTLRFTRESSDEIIHFVSKRVEVIYATGMQVNDAGNLSNGESPLGVVTDPSQINWLKRGDLNLNIIGGLRLNGGFVIQETLGNPNPDKNLTEFDRMQFHTNQVNVQVGPEVKISETVSLSGKFLYEDALHGRSLGFISGVDIKTNSGAQLMIFTSFKAPVDPLRQPIPMAPGAAGAAAGVKVLLPQGPAIKAGVTGLGTDLPVFEGGLSIPLESVPKK